MCRSARQFADLDESRPDLRARCRHALLRGLEHRQCDQSIRSAREAKWAAGSLAVSVIRDADRAFWTRTVWRDEGAMRAFMRSGVHRRVMAHLPEWCDEAALAHWVQEANEPPSWAEAHRRLQQEGRRSRVNHPTAAQRRFEIREPRVSTGLTFK